MDTIISLSDHSRSEPIEGKLGYLSQSGMRVYVRSGITLGTSLNVEYEGLVARGIVWDSRRFKEGYSIGIEFQTVSRRNL